MAWDTFGTSEQQEKTVSILSALVAADTSNPPGNEEPLAEAIMALLRENGAGEELFSLVRHTPGRASLVVSLPGKNSVVVAFAGHLDVVPAGRPEAWTHPPFAPYVENGVLHGRGAADMKGGLTSMLLVCLHYLRQDPPPVTLRFFFTADEESGGAGISALRGAGWFEDVSFLFICEPTACRAGLCEKGLMWLKCTATGRTSHAAMAAEGVNAAELGFAFLMEAKPRMEALFGTHAYLGQNSFSVTMMEAGVKLNVVPDAADFSVDVRTIPAAGFCNERLLEEARALAAAFAARCPGLSLDIEVLNTREALESDAAHPATAEALALCDEVANAGPPRGLSFFTDGALVLIHYPRLPFLILGPGEPALCHAPNEAVPLREVGLCAEMYRAFVERAAEKGLL